MVDSRSAPSWLRTLRGGGAGIFSGVAIPLSVPLDQTFDALYGLEIIDMSDEQVTAQVVVRDAVRQALGLVHGGVFASIAESLASVGTWRAVAADGNLAVGLANQTSFLRPIIEGVIHAVARPRHRGRTTWLWDVEISDDDGRLCAISRMTIAVRPAPAGAETQPR